MGVGAANTFLKRFQQGGDAAAELVSCGACAIQDLRCTLRVAEPEVTFRVPEAMLHISRAVLSSPSPPPSSAEHHDEEWRLVIRCQVRHDIKHEDEAPQTQDHFDLCTLSTSQPMAAVDFRICSLHAPHGSTVQLSYRASGAASLSNLLRDVEVVILGTY